MPRIYLSPSLQEWNPYVDGGNEEYYMNLVADAMEPYLVASGIQFVRNTPEMTAASSIAASNRGVFDLHLALHSNATGSGDGSVRGSEVYYNPQNSQSKRFADIAAKNLKLIYPIPQNVRTVPTSSLGEVVRTKAPGVLMEIAYHDNAQDAQWIRDNIELIAANIVLSLTEFFGIPFNTPVPITVGNVATNGGNLNVRTRPSTDAFVVGRIPNGAEITIYARVPGWALVGYNGIVGYASDRYINFG
jgi:N-acetylmuramoyl-L-alanine amidase